MTTYKQLHGQNKPLYSCSTVNIDSLKRCFVKVSETNIESLWKRTGYKKKCLLELLFKAYFSKLFKVLNVENVYIKR